jgi:hypothetical protein
VQAVAAHAAVPEPTTGEGRPCRAGEDVDEELDDQRHGECHQEDDNQFAGLPEGCCASRTHEIVVDLCLKRGIGVLKEAEGRREEGRRKKGLLQGSLRTSAKPAFTQLGQAVISFRGNVTVNAMTLPLP